MTLDPTQHQTLTTWMAQKGVRPECPACGSTTGRTPGGIVAEMRVTPRGLHVGDPVLPLVQLICNHCAHLMLFAAEPIGLYQPRDCDRTG
ncbi:MAG: hypothetical protein ACJ78Q_18155 [Chloroflexia bacterium]